MNTAFFYIKKVSNGGGKDVLRGSIRDGFAIRFDFMLPFLVVGCPADYPLP
jgi:hypothetical protein